MASGQISYGQNVVSHLAVTHMLAFHSLLLSTSLLLYRVLKDGHTGARLMADPEWSRF